MTEIYMGNNYEKENTIDSSGCMPDRCFGGSAFCVVFQKIVRS